MLYESTYCPNFYIFFYKFFESSFGENIEKLVSARKYVLVKIKPKMTVVVHSSVGKEQMILSPVFIVLQKTSREGFFVD